MTSTASQPIINTDLVLLDANPLENVANLARRAGVMAGGRWVSGADLDRGLAQLAEKFAQ